MRNIVRSPFTLPYSIRPRESHVPANRDRFFGPRKTARIANAAFPKGNPYMKMRDLLGTLFEDEQFTPLFPPQGQPAEAPWRLALTSVFQFAEGLSDRQAADAVRSRIDWKYAQGSVSHRSRLPLLYPLRVSSTACARRSRDPIARHDAKALCGAGLTQSRRQAAYR